MLKNFYLEGTNIELWTIVAILVSLGCGLLITAAYKFRAKHTTDSFVITLVLLPFLAQVVILLVNRFGHIGMGVAVAGAFSMVRFRSIPGTAREITFVFFAMSVGIATGSGLLYFAPLYTLIVIGVFLCLQVLLSMSEKTVDRELRIQTPDDLDYNAEIEPIFKKHNVKYELTATRTKNMGAIFELTYRISYGQNTKEKDFIDDIRVANRNYMVASTLWSIAKDTNGEL